MQDKEVILVEIKGLQKVLDEKFANNDKAHDAILVQTTKTNGRVSCLEDGLVQEKIWRAKLIGGFIVSNIVLWPIILLLIKKYFNL